MRSWLICGGVLLVVIGAIIGGIFVWAGGPSRIVCRPHLPRSGTVLRGRVSLYASCAGGTPSSVLFYVDQRQVGSTSSYPYSVSWNSTGVQDGSHSVSAAASGGKRTSITVATSNGNKAQRYVSTNGTDSGTCSIPDTACATFNYAYDQSSCGDLVQIGPGKYPQQTVADQPSKDGTCTSSSRVTFQPTRGAAVHIAGLYLGQTTGAGRRAFLGPQHLALDSGEGRVVFDTQTTAGGLMLGPGSDDILINGITANGASIECGGCHDTTVENTMVENVVATASLPLAPVELFGGSDGRRDYVPTSVTLKGDTFHDITTSNGVNWHIECIFIKDTNSVTITDSVFYHCQIYDIFIQLFPNPGAELNNIVVTNNVFGQAFQNWAGGSGFRDPNDTALYWDQAGRPGYTSTGNVFAFNATPLECAGCQKASKNLTAPIPSFNLDSDGDISATVTGNIGGNQACTAGTGTITWNNNLTVAFSGSTFTTACGTNTVQAWNAGYFGYTRNGDPPSGDLALAPDSPAIAMVPLSDCRAALGSGPRDMTGAFRAHTNHYSACDAGAYENR